MSAFLVSNAHIDLLVAARRIPHFGVNICNSMTDTDLGRMLLTENHQSVSHRYPTDEGACPSYRFRPVFTMPSVTAILKAIACYEYQSCEHDGWLKSDARKYCHALRGMLITCLPGYDEAPWGTEEEHLGRTTRKAV